MSIRITKCLCFDVEFSTLVRIAKKSGATTIPALQEEITFGKRCRLCHPYVKRALETGESIFTELIFDDQVDRDEIP